MEKELIEKKLLQVISEYKSSQNIASDDADFINEMIDDSLKFLKFIITLEEAFDIYIEEEYLVEERFSCFDDIVDIINIIIVDGDKNID